MEATEAQWNILFMVTQLSKPHNQRSGPEPVFFTPPTASQQGWKELAVRGHKFLFPSMVTQATVNCLTIHINLFGTFSIFQSVAGPRSGTILNILSVIAWWTQVFAIMRSLTWDRQEVWGSDPTTESGPDEEIQAW